MRFAPHETKARPPSDPARIRRARRNALHLGIETAEYHHAAREHLVKDQWQFGPRPPHFGEVVSLQQKALDLRERSGYDGRLRAYGDDGYRRILVLLPQVIEPFYCGQTCACG